MDIKYSLLFFFSLCVLEIVQLTPVPYKILSTEELHQIALKCIDEIKIDKTVIEEVLRTEIIPRDNKKYKKYLACSYKKQGYLSSDGTKMLYDNLFQFLQNFYDIADLKELDHCKSIKEDNEGELCYQNLDCILTGLRKIEGRNEIKVEEDINSNTI